MRCEPCHLLKILYLPTKCEREQKTEQTYNGNSQLVTVHVTDIDQLNTVQFYYDVIAIANLFLSRMLVRQAKIDFRSSHLVFCGGLQIVRRDRFLNFSLQCPQLLLQR